MTEIADLIQESTNTSGTGLTITLGAVTGFARFADGFSVSDSIYYSIEDGNDKEVGIGTVQAGNTLDRTTPLVTYDAGVYDDSSPARISLSGSAAKVFCGPQEATRKQADITSGTIDGTIIGGITPAAGTFTTLASTGIDDNATDEVLQLTDSAAQFGIAATNYTIGRSDTASITYLVSGPSLASGANIVLSGATHATANDLKLRAGSNSFFVWDESAGDLEILTGTGAKASALTIDSSQNIYSTTGATGMTNGFIYIPAAAGAPSGVVGLATATLAAMYFDTTNKKLYCYNHVSDAWEGVTLA